MSDKYSLVDSVAHQVLHDMDRQIADLLKLAGVTAACSVKLYPIQIETEEFGGKTLFRYSRYWDVLGPDGVVIATNRPGGSKT